MPILDAINKENADLFIFLGDNVYGDTENMDVLASKYKQLGDIPGIKKLKENTEVIAIWDDHDYGENDAGIEYAQKEKSREIMLDFFNEAKDSPRRTRPDGIYTSYMYGEGEQKVQVILPDLRWNRSKLASVSNSEYQNKRKALKMGPYKIHTDKSASMLGESQWDWLEIQLQKPSAIKIIGSSLQLLPEFTGWESWANFPQDRQRLMDLIHKYQVNGILIISGDTHWGEVSKVNNLIDYPLWEVTSSGLTEKWKHVSPNSHRVGNFTNQVNYGEILIDWHKKDPTISFGLKDIVGKVTHRHQIMLSEISPYKL
jgi:alkaline phosphatase D